LIRTRRARPNGGARSRSPKQTGFPRMPMDKRFTTRSRPRSQNIRRKIDIRRHRTASVRCRVLMIELQITWDQNFSAVRRKVEKVQVDRDDETRFTWLHRNPFHAYV